MERVTIALGMSGVSLLVFMVWSVIWTTPEIDSVRVKIVITTFFGVFWLIAFYTIYLNIKDCFLKKIK